MDCTFYKCCQILKRNRALKGKKEEVKIDAICNF